jgi:hypothetical protein
MAYQTVEVLTETAKLEWQLNKWDASWALGRVRLSPPSGDQSP